MDLQKEVLQPFNPRAPAYRWKLVARIVHENGARWHIFWRRVALALVATAVAGWLLAVAGLWGFLRYRRHWEGARYPQLVLYPWTKHDIRLALAEHNLRLGRIEIENKNYSEGYALLAAGLRWHPEDLQARRTLAITDVRFGNVPRALNRLAEGIRYQPDLEYYKLLFGWLLEARQDERALTIARDLLPARPTGGLTPRFIALQAATVHFHHGRYDEMERLIGDWGLENSLEGLLLLAGGDWERGQEERALARLQSEFERFKDRDELYLQLIKFHREAGNDAEARRIALLRQFNMPASPGPRLDLLHGYRATGDLGAEAREIAAYLAEFGRDGKALEMLAWYAADTLQARVLADVAERAASLGSDRREIELARVQLALNEQRFNEAVELCEHARDSKVAGDDWRFPAFRAIALFGIADTNAAAALKASLAAARLRTGDALLLSRHLRLVAQPAAARSVLEHCHAYDPADQAVLAEILRLDAEARNRDGLAQALPKYLALRKPSRAILEEALLALDPIKDAALMAELRRALRRPADAPANEPGTLAQTFTRR